MSLVRSKKKKKSCLLRFSVQQAETHIKRRMGIGTRISERRLIDDLTRMGLNESIVSEKLPLCNPSSLLLQHVNIAMPLFLSLS